MNLRQQLLQFHEDLLKGGFHQEAEEIGHVSHYVPKSIPGVPDFLRKNYDYGEGLYQGDMSNKESVGDFLKKHHEKGPNWPKKKKKAEMVVEASPRMETLEKNKRPLTDEERQKVMDAGATWNFGKDGAPSPAIWKAEVDGKTWFVCHTHRAYQAKPTLGQAIKAFEFIETTS
jgi:hypothetical protein